MDHAKLRWPITDHKEKYHINHIESRITSKTNHVRKAGQSWGIKNAIKVKWKKGWDPPMLSLYILLVSPFCSVPLYVSIFLSCLFLAPFLPYTAQQG